MKGIFPIEGFKAMETPFYYYNTELLRQTLSTINIEAGKHEQFSNYKFQRYNRTNFV